MVKSEFSVIPDVMQCIVTCFFMGHNESYVESIGSKLKHRNPPNRNITLEHLEEELIVAWNGSEEPHCDILVKETIELMHGPGKWHFQRSSHVSHLKFYEVSESVDNLHNRKSNFFPDEL